ncbi:MAG: copper chaperone [Woeseia sp.]
MKQLIGSALLSLAISTAALADGMIYHIFADGLTCQQCALAIAKQLRKIEGVERVDILSERGIVNVRMADGYALSEHQAATMFADAGVTFRRMEQHPVGAGGSGSTVLPPVVGVKETS